MLVTLARVLTLVDGMMLLGKRGLCGIGSRWCAVAWLFERSRKQAETRAVRRTAARSWWFLDPLPPILNECIFPSTSGLPGMLAKGIQPVIRALPNAPGKVPVSRR